MSAGYASRLKEYPNKGVVGLPEFQETKRALQQKLDQLITMMDRSKYIVVLTGAGISTNAGIPDFRGPNGIWTIEKQKGKRKTKTYNKKRKRNNNNNNNDKGESRDQEEDPTKTSNNDTNNDTILMDFSQAQPTLTHRIITKLVSLGTIKYCITQNVDGLHRRSGLSRNYHCSIHGCAFTEVCSNPNCQMEYFRDDDVGGMSFQPTGNKCTGNNSNSSSSSNTTNTATSTTATTASVTNTTTKSNPNSKTNNSNNNNNNNNNNTNATTNYNYNDYDYCGEALVDTLLDWEDPLPEKDFQRAENECDKADLVLCLGTSLRIEPAGSLPLRAKQFVIVNLQKTAKDEFASLIIRTNVDVVMEYILKHVLLSVHKKKKKSSTETEKNGNNKNENGKVDDNNDKNDENEEFLNGDELYEQWKQEPPPPIERIWKPNTTTTTTRTTTKTNNHNSDNKSKK